jgi:Na+/H+-dicarboxylate symporter
MRYISTLSVARMSKAVNRPSITISAVVLGVWLGTMRYPFLRYLQPVGDFYIALLQMCVLPFLLATIPLAVRSALTSGTGGKVVGQLIIWLIVTLIAVAAIAVLVPTAIFSAMPLDQATASRIGTLFGATANRVDLEFALQPELASAASAATDTGLLAVVPTNVFAALSTNDSLRVIVFAIVFGIGMVLSERHSGTSIFGALRHIQAVCILIFDWFNVLLPIGIVALIAPQVALLGPDVYAVLAPFAYAFLATTLVLLLMPIVVVSIGLRLDPRMVFAKMLRPLALAVATRNALMCAPAALETMKQEFRARAGPCDLFIPIGFAVVRFGPIIHFATAALFVGYLLGRPFGGFELVLVAGLAVMASFATIGVSGVAGLIPMAAVLRPFGLSYELALPLMVIVDPIAAMIRAMFNVALNMQIPVLAGGREEPAVAAVEAPAPTSAG